VWNVVIQTSFFRVSSTDSTSAHPCWAVFNSASASAFSCTIQHPALHVNNIHTLIILLDIQCVRQNVPLCFWLQLCPILTDFHILSLLERGWNCQNQQCINSYIHLLQSNLCHCFGRKIFENLILLEISRKYWFQPGNHELQFPFELAFAVWLNRINSGYSGFSGYKFLKRLHWFSELFWEKFLNLQPSVYKWLCR